MAAQRKRRRSRYKLTVRRAVRTAKRVAKTVKRYAFALFSILVGIGIAYEVDQLWQTSLRTDLIVAGSVAAFVLLVKLFASFGYGAIYVVIVSHPVTGKRVCGYVGKTTQNPPDRRIEQHLYGSAYFDTPAKPWEDTVIRWYLPHASRWFTSRTLHLFELVNIKLRRPIYNDRMNLTNPRRIPIPVQYAQRLDRNVTRYGRV